MNLRPKFYNGWLMLFLMIWAASCFSQLPPSPPGAITTRSPKDSTESSMRMTTAVAVPGMTNGTFRIEVVSLPPLNQIVSFFVATNCPPRWRLERSLDLVNWTLLEQWETLSNYPRHMVPRLRDDAKLVTWCIEKPEKARFFRLKVLP